MIVFNGAENHSKNPIGSVVPSVNVPRDNVPVGIMNDSTTRTKKQASCQFPTKRPQNTFIYDKLILRTQTFQKVSDWINNLDTLYPLYNPIEGNKGCLPPIPLLHAGNRLFHCADIF